MDADNDLTLATTTSDDPGEAWLARREQLMNLIHNLRVSAPLLHHRVLRTAGPGAIKFDDGCEVVVAGIPGTLIVRLTAPSWCSTSEQPGFRRACQRPRRPLDRGLPHGISRYASGYRATPLTTLYAAA